MNLRPIIPFFESEPARVRDPFDSSWWGIDPFLGLKPSDLLNTSQFQVDVRDDDGDLLVSANLPGVLEDDLDVTLDHDILTIKGETQSEKKTDEGEYHMRERRYGGFSRSIRLPFTPEFKDIDAELKKGVLSLCIKRPESEQGSQKRIPIST